MLRFLNIIIIVFTVSMFICCNSQEGSRLKRRERKLILVKVKHNRFLREMGQMSIYTPFKL